MDDAGALGFDIQLRVLKRNHKTHNSSKRMFPAFAD